MTGEVNPLAAVTVTDTVDDAPAPTVRLELEIERLKSGLGGLGGLGGLVGC